MITLLLLAVLAGAAVMFYFEGLWSALVALINVLFAAAFATAWYEWPANLLQQAMPSFGSLADFVCVWIIFAVVLLAVGEATNRVSRTRVMFQPEVDRYGAPVVGLLVGWILVCFTAMTLHLAPVTKDLIQPAPDERLFLGLAPDRKWVSFVGNSTRAGPFSNPGANEANAFDKDRDFVERHANRRAKLEGETSLLVQP